MRFALQVLAAAEQLPVGALGPLGSAALRGLSLLGQCNAAAFSIQTAAQQGAAAAADWGGGHGLGLRGGSQDDGWPEGMAP